MRIRFLVLGTIVSVSALALTSACGSSNNSNKSGSGGSAGSAAGAGGSAAGAGGSAAGAGGAGATGDCKTVATALCNRLQHCSPLAVQVTYGDVATCISRSEKGCAENTSAPGASVKPAQFASCATAFSQLDCNDFTRPGFVPSECDIPGSLANGKACGSPDQCQSGYCSVSNGICGTCGQRSAAGKSCLTDRDCQSGLVCNSQHVCAQPITTGGSCKGPLDCSAGLVCASGKCAAPLDVGKTCTQGSCNPLAGAFCNAKTTACQLIKVADAGQPCGIVGGDYVQCSASGRCTATLQQPEGKCVAHAADGADCTATNCLLPAVCVNGKCTLPNPSSCKCTTNCK